MRRLATAAVLLLVAGCGLPVTSGVHDPGQVPPEQRQSGGVQVLPPGPRDDATPAEVVQDFFGAQSNPTDRHASARAFLAPGAAARWQDSGPVNIYDGALTSVQVPGNAMTFRVTAQVVGRIDIDGSFTREGGPITLLVQLRRGARGRWQISTVPDGLLISTADRDPSFRPRNVFFVAPPAADGRPSTHLVPDRVFIPVTVDAVDALVRRLLAGPSRDLRASVLTSFPPGTSVRRVSSDASGLVTVDLSGQVAKASDRAKAEMSAQLVWTLRSLPSGFAKLRLLSDGQDVRVPGTTGGSGLQDHDDWAAYAPDGLPSRAPLYYISRRRLRLLAAAGGSDQPGTQQPVDVAAVSARTSGVALVTRLGASGDLRVGAFGGAYAVRFHGPGLASPTWGSGERGVWFLSGSTLLFAPLRGPVVQVPVDGAPAAISAIRVSRDGARAAVVAGRGDSARLLVGPVSFVGGVPRIGPLVPIAPEVTGVRSLSWNSATDLVVLGDTAGVTAPVRVSVDGSTVELINEVGLVDSDLRSVAAAPNRPLVVGAAVAGRSTLFRDNGLVYKPEPGVVGDNPFYPD